MHDPVECPLCREVHRPDWVLRSFAIMTVAVWMIVVATLTVSWLLR